MIRLARTPLRTHDAPLWTPEAARVATAPLLPRWNRRNYRLAQFVREAWEHVEAEEYVHGWHIDAVCEHLEAVVETVAPVSYYPMQPRVRNLLINVPPRSSKSLIAAVFFPAWVWIEWPQCQFLFVSYAEALSIRDSDRCRKLLESVWYQERWGNRWQFEASQNTKKYYRNSAGGARVATSVGAMATGFGGHIVVGDDLHSTSEDLSETRAEIQTAGDYWLTSIISRSINPKRMGKVVLGQRVADDDASGRLLQGGQYDYLCIPMEYDPELAQETVLGWRDPRETEGELMAPERFGTKEVDELKGALGHRYFAQYQQNPQIESISLFPPAWWNRFDVWPQMSWFSAIIQSWDFNFGDEKEAATSYVAGHLWARHGPPQTGQVYLLDRYFQQVGFTESCQAVVDMSEKWPGAYHKLIEYKANGPAIYSTLRNRVFGLKPVQVGGKYSSKYARANAVGFLMKQRRAWVPSDTLAPWAKQFVDHMRRFPAPPNDDGDATSQAWAVLCPPVPVQDVVMRQQREAAERKRAREMLARQQLRLPAGFGGTRA